MDAIDRTLTGLRAARSCLDRAIAAADGWPLHREAEVDAAIADAITALDLAFAEWSERSEHSADVIDLDRWRRSRSA